jgi:hypothetical protein
MVDPAFDLDDVERALAALLIREVNISVSGVPGLGGASTRGVSQNRGPSTPRAWSDAFATDALEPACT